MEEKQTQNKYENYQTRKLDGYIDSPTQETVLKVSTSDLTVLSKFLADTRNRFTVLETSRIMVSENHTYFAYVHIANEAIADRLQEISPFP
jgi:hypothetical protein